MNPLAHYAHLHLAGAAAGIDLFERSSTSQRDPEIARTIAALQQQLHEERRVLRRIAHDLGVGESRVLTTAARVGERVGRLKPNGHVLRRSPLSDLLELEAMLTAVTGKGAGWRALLSIADEHPALDHAELTQLSDQAEAQRRQLADLHTAAATQALSQR